MNNPLNPSTIWKKGPKKSRSLNSYKREAYEIYKRMKSEDVLDEEMESYIIYSIIYAEVHYKPGKASLKAFKFKCSKFAMMRYDFKINREKKRMREYSLAKGATNGGDLKIKSRDGYYIEDPLERLRTLELMEKIKEIIDCLFGGFLVKVIISIVFTIVGLFILYIVIETAVRKGINNSIIGQFLEKKYGIKEDKKSFLDDDLDNENKTDY